MSVMDKILGAADFPPPAPPSPFPLDESRISHHHTPQKNPTTTAFLSPSPLRQPPPSPSSSSTLPPKKIPTADLATTPKIKKLLSQVANQRDTAIDKIKLMQGTNAELKTKLSEMSRYKDKCEKLERELESLQSALDSSERIRESQRDLIKMLQEGHGHGHGQGGLSLSTISLLNTGNDSFSLVDQAVRMNEKYGGFEIRGVNTNVDKPQEEEVEQAATETMPNPTPKPKPKPTLKLSSPSPTSKSKARRKSSTLAKTKSSPATTTPRKKVGILQPSKTITTPTTTTTTTTTTTPRKAASVVSKKTRRSTTAK
ncbi:hypothetical protein ScalyP_jg3326 [Parmales sp. scaly parma]|nr:hypothetical protein ScalyP_jg3326 [Parmales sp. scaly parma]